MHYGVYFENPALSHLVVGDLLFLSQWTASKNAAFQNLKVCLLRKKIKRNRYTQTNISISMWQMIRHCE